VRIQNSDITLHQGDAFDLLKTIQDNSIDAIVTDPPYFIGMVNQHTLKSDWDNGSKDDYVKFLSKLFIEFERVLRPGGQAWMFYGVTMTEQVVEALHTITGILKPNWENAMIYARNKGRGSTKKLKSLREDILHLSKGKYDTWNFVEYARRVICPYVKDGKPRGWAIDIETGIPMRFTGMGGVCFFSAPAYHSKFEKLIHTCQKPVLLNVMLTMLSTKAGDVVLDPFMGSGSSAVAAAITERNYIGIEKDPIYIREATKWLTNIDWNEADNYVKRRVSTVEKGFKFGLESRPILPKVNS
jgi:site-specific DNA-methyltransferase (adenine-specific)